MSSNQSDINSRAPHEESDDNYVDPILFSEGIYTDKADYEQFIDGFVARINSGAATPRGREEKRPTPRLIATRLASKEPTTDAFKDAIASLNANEQHLVRLRFVQDLTIAEISEELNISLGVTQSRLHGVLKKLQRLLSGASEVSAVKKK